MLEREVHGSAPRVGCITRQREVRVHWQTALTGEDHRAHGRAVLAHRQDELQRRRRPCTGARSRPTHRSRQPLPLPSHTAAAAQDTQITQEAAARTTPLVPDTHATCRRAARRRRRYRPGPPRSARLCAVSGGGRGLRATLTSPAHRVDEVEAVNQVAPVVQEGEDLLRASGHHDAQVVLHVRVRVLRDQHEVVGRVLAPHASRLIGRGLSVRRLVLLAQPVRHALRAVSFHLGDGLLGRLRAGGAASGLRAEPWRAPAREAPAQAPDCTPGVRAAALGSRPLGTPSRAPGPATRRSRAQGRAPRCAARPGRELHPAWRSRADARAVGGALRLCGDS